MARPLYDQWHFRGGGERVVDEGLAITEVHQTNERHGPATREFCDAVLDRRITDDGDATLVEHLRTSPGEARRPWSGRTNNHSASVAPRGTVRNPLA